MRGGCARARRQSACPKRTRPMSRPLLEERAACAFVVCGDATGRDMAARVAGILDAPMVSEASEAAYRRRGHVRFPPCVRRRRGALRAHRGLSGWSASRPARGLRSRPTVRRPPIVAVDGNPDARMQLVEVQPLEKGGADLTKAERIVCAGMAFSTRDELGAAFRLAGALGAEVGCTRGLAEDHHWFPSYIGLFRRAGGAEALCGLGRFGPGCSTRWASAARRWSWR